MDSQSQQDALTVGISTFKEVKGLNLLEMVPKFEFPIVV